MIARTVDTHLGEIRLNHLKSLYTLSWEQRETACCVCTDVCMCVHKCVCVYKCKALFFHL